VRITVNTNLARQDSEKSQPINRKNESQLCRARNMVQDAAVAIDKRRCRKKY